MLRNGTGLARERKSPGIPGLRRPVSRSITPFAQGKEKRFVVKLLALQARGSLIVWANFRQAVRRLSSLNWLTRFRRSTCCFFNLPPPVIPDPTPPPPALQARRPIDCTRQVAASDLLHTGQATDT